MNLHSVPEPSFELIGKPPPTWVHATVFLKATTPEYVAKGFTDRQLLVASVKLSDNEGDLFWSPWIVHGLVMVKTGDGHIHHHNKDFVSKVEYGPIEI